MGSLKNLRNICICNGTPLIVGIKQQFAESILPFTLYLLNKCKPALISKIPLLYLLLLFSGQALGISKVKKTLGVCTLVNWPMEGEHTRQAVIAFDKRQA